MQDVPFAMRRRLGMVTGMSEAELGNFNSKPDWNFNYQSAWFRVQKMVQSPVLYDASGIRTQVPEIETQETEEVCVHDSEYAEEAGIWMDLALDSIKHLPSAAADLPKSQTRDEEEVMDHDSFMVACNLVPAKGQTEEQPPSSSVVKHLSPTNVTDNPFFLEQADEEPLKP
eukprot:303327-Rhodomonas_salina.1